MTMRNIIASARDSLADVSDAAVASVAGKTAVVSGITAGFGGLTSTDIAAFGGLAIAAITGIVGLIYKHKDNARQARLAAIDEEIKMIQRDRWRDSDRHPTVCD